MDHFTSFSKMAGKVQLRDEYRVRVLEGPIANSRESLPESDGVVIACGRQDHCLRVEPPDILPVTKKKKKKKRKKRKKEGAWFPAFRLIRKEHWPQSTHSSRWLTCHFRLVSFNFLSCFFCSFFLLFLFFFFFFFFPR